MLTFSTREYVKITKDYTLEAAKAFANILENTEPFRFVFVSGEGATHTPGRFSPIFARVKGETELALAEMSKTTPTLRTDTVRPAIVDSVAHEAIQPFEHVRGGHAQHDLVFHQEYAPRPLALG